MINKDKLGKYLFNPFIYLSDYKALTIGILFILLAGYIGSFGNAYFDGVLDVHLGSKRPIGYYLIIGVIDWLCLATVLLLLGLIVKKTKCRMIDIFGTQALARWPSVFSGLAVALIKSDPIRITLSSIIISILLVLFICWMVVLMYNSYKISFDLKGVRLYGTFIAGIIVAEIISKVIILKIL